MRFSESQGPSEGVGIFAAAIVLLFTFGSLVAAGLPLMATLLALGCALGVITLISHLVDTPDFATQLASLIGLGVGIDYSLFVVTRFRSEVRAGRDRDAAIEKAIDTAGRTVMFAAITVVIALLGLLLLGLSFMHGVALGAAAAVLAVMLSALTIIPALIGGSGPFMDGVLRRVRPARRLPLLGHEAPHPHPRARPGGRGAARSASAGGPRARAGSAGRARVQRRPWLAAAASLVVLLGLALPALNLRLGSSDAGVDPPGTTTRKAYDLIAEGFGAGTNGSFLLVAELARRRATRPRPSRSPPPSSGDHDFTFVSPPTHLAGRPGGDDHRLPEDRAAGRSGPPTRSTGCATTSCRRSSSSTGTTVEVGGFTASNGGLLAAWWPASSRCSSAWSSC